MASDKHYVNEIGTEVVIDCGEDISMSTVHTLLVRKPDGATVEWSASIYQSNFLLYTVVSGDFDQEGEYAIQPYLTLPGWLGRGQTVKFYVYGLFDSD